MNQSLNIDCIAGFTNGQANLITKVNDALHASISCSCLQHWEEVLVDMDSPFPEWILTNATAVCLGYGGDSPQLLVIGKRTTSENCAWLLDVFSWQWNEVIMMKSMY